MEGARAGRREQGALLAARRWGRGQVEREGGPWFGGGPSGPRGEPQEVEEGFRLSGSLSVDGSFRFRVPGLFSPGTGEQYTFQGRGKTGDSPQGPFCPVQPRGHLAMAGGVVVAAAQAGTGIQEEEARNAASRAAGPRTAPQQLMTVVLTEITVIIFLFNPEGNQS